MIVIILIPVGRHPDGDDNKDPIFYRETGVHT